MRKNRPFKVSSASQTNTAALCLRKWYFEKVKRLPTPLRRHFAFGTVLHEVCERYLEADDNGRGPDGEPVELFPPGWRTTVDYKGVRQTVTKAEGELIKRLIQEAIKAGVLERSTQRKIEYTIPRGFLPVVEREDGKDVSLIGKIDVLRVPQGIEDHKTTKSWRYAESEKSLAENRQLLIYAKAYVEWCKEKGHPVPDQILLRHNYFLKRPENPEVRKVETHVDVEQIEEAWADVQAINKRMAEVAQYDDFELVPMPPNVHKACNAYGGCHFRSICFENESLARYTNRMEAHNKRYKAKEQARLNKAKRKKRLTKPKERGNMSDPFSKLSIFPTEKPDEEEASEVPKASSGPPKINPDKVSEKSRKKVTKKVKKVSKPTPSASNGTEGAALHVKLVPDYQAAKAYIKETNTLPPGWDVEFTITD